MTFLQIFSVVGFHTLFDWILQTRWQAENKSKNWGALSRHVSVYNLGLSLMMTRLFPSGESFGVLVGWVWLNTGLHFVTDAVTSRINAKLYPNKGFWNCIGINQCIHYITLFGTYFLFK